MKREKKRDGKRLYFTAFDNGRLQSFAVVFELVGRSVV